jgi:pSer/pThr/pTyr-binding forkhead associated (FHA) protein/uncharacterized protein involved in exopolysaccharide biosynthesis
MPGERAADKRGSQMGGGLSDDGLDAELDRAVGGDPIAYVIVFAGDQPGRVHSLNRNTVLLGRVDDADIHIVDASVSARHAQIINGGHGFEIEDLGSTNGTLVGGQRVGRAPLRNGDRVTVGSVELLFLVDRPVDTTIALLPPAKRSVVQMTGALPVAHAPRVIRPRDGDGDRDDDDGPSLAEIVRRVVGVLAFIRQRWLSIVLLAAIGSLLGLASMVPLPPRSLAECDVKLVPQVKSNPVDPQFRPPSDDDSLLFFRGAERAFVQPDLVRSTMRKMADSSKDSKRGPGQAPNKDPADEELASVASRLKLEPVGDHLFHASYRDRLFRGERTPLVTFLAIHVQNYVRSEIDKSLREFTGKAEFLRDQMKGVEKELARVDDEKTKFREANTDSLPEDAAQTHSSRFQLQTRRADVLAQIRRLEGELDAERRQLTAETPLAQAKLQSSQVYRDSTADLNRKLSEAYARGLAEGHPEVQRLQSEKLRIEGLISAEMRASSSNLDRQSNAGYQALQHRVDTLHAQLKAARNDLADIEKSLGQIRQVVGDLPRVEQRLADLSRVQEVTTRLHGQLFEKLKQAELQLNLERVSAESRYEITPPRLERPKTSTTIVLRCSLGLLVGLAAAAFVILVREGRRFVRQALASPEPRRRESRS